MNLHLERLKLRMARTLRWAHQRWWDWSSDLGWIVAVLVGLILAVGVICLFWIAFVTVQQSFLHVRGAR